ncbi:MAG: hypothetical protein HOV94_43975, partial [Saccharothrix sp.]|nr:hypothetical protein [Saccharothrix sp.]
MTQPEYGALLPTQRVATAMGVSQMRIRQLMAEGRLPPPITLSRDHAWHYTDVAAAKALHQGRRASIPTGMLTDATEPLTRHDLMLRIPGFGRSTLVHARLWTGRVDDRDRHVAVLSQPRYHGGLNNALPDVLGTVLVDHLGLVPDDVFDVTWVLYRPHDHYPQSQTLDHLMWIESPGERVTSRFGRAMSVVFGSWDADESAAHTLPPVHREITWAELERIVGGPVEAYPHEAYTPDTIAAWERAGHTVDVEHDTIELRRLTRAAHVLHQHSPAWSGDPGRSDDVLSAVHMLADEIRLRLPMLEHGWDDGTRNDHLKPLPTAELSWPTTWAARLVPPAPTKDDQALLDLYPQDVSDRVYELDRNSKLHLVNSLRHFQEECDEYADHPDQALYQALDTAANLLAIRLGVRAEDVYRRTIHTVAVEPTGWDQRYLDSVSWLDPAPNTARHRRLLAELTSSGLVGHPERVRIGYDLGGRGRAVAHYSGDAAEQLPAWMAVEWPQQPDQWHPVPPGTQ